MVFELNFNTEPIYSERTHNSRAPSLKPGKLSFFKVSCNLEIWSHRNEFLMLCYMKIHWSILYFEHILYTCLLDSWNQALTIWKILESLISDADLSKVPTLYYTLSAESHLLVLPPISQKKLLSIWELLSICQAPSEKF